MIKLIKTFVFIIVICFQAIYGLDKAEHAAEFPVLKGMYLGQKPPESTPELFAPELVKNCPSFTPDLKEIYFRGQKVKGISFMQFKNDEWTFPLTVSFSNDEYSDFNPYLSPDGTKLVFASNRSISEDAKLNAGCDIFLIKRTKNGWGEPVSFGKKVNSDKIDGCPTITRSGNLYFFSNREGTNDVYVSRFIDSQYTKSENLGYPINTERDECDPFIAPDESYIIVCISGREDCFGKNDLYISFKKDKKSWTEPINMGNKINTDAKELFPRVSPDGRYLFFTSNKAGSYYTYWVNANIIEEFRQKEINK